MSPEGWSRIREAGVRDEELKRRERIRKTAARFRAIPGTA